jgi:hypothetical protein
MLIFVNQFGWHVAIDDFFENSPVICHGKLSVLKRASASAGAIDH